MPVDHVKRRDDAIIIAVNLNSTLSNETVIEKKTGPDTTTTLPPESESQAILTKLRNFFNSASKNETKTVAAVDATSLSMFELLNASYDATLDRLVEVNLQRTPADVLVEIPRNSCSVFEFHRAAELINIGKTAYTNAMVKSGLKDLTL